MKIAVTLITLAALVLAQAAPIPTANQVAKRQDVACLQQGDTLNVGAALNDVGKDVGSLLTKTIGSVGARLNVVNGAVGTVSDALKLSGNLLGGLFNPTCKLAAVVNPNTGQLSNSA